MKIKIRKRILPFLLALSIILISFCFCQTAALAASGADTTVSVTSYGADGSDKKDDSDAFIKALGVSHTGATLTVNVPAGTYYISKPLIIYSDTKLILNENATVVRTDLKNCMLSSAQTDLGAYSQFKNIVISGGTWNGNANDGKIASNLFTFYHGNNISIENTVLKKCCGEHFIEFAAVSNININNVTCRDFVEYADTDYDFSVSDKDDGSGVSIRSEAIQFDIAMSSSSPNALPTDNTPCKNITVEKCSFINCCAGVGNHHKGNDTKTVKIINNSFKNMKAACVNLSNFTDVTVSGNTASEVGSFLWCISNSKGTVSNNDVNALTSLPEKLKQDVIGVTDSSMAISDNTINGSAKNAITLQNSVGSQITGNTIGNSGKNGIFIDKQSDVTIKNNTVSNSKSNGIYARSSTVSASSNTISGSGIHGIYIEGSKLNLTSNHINNSASKSICVADGSSAKSTGAVSDNVLSVQNIQIQSSGVTQKNNTVYKLAVPAVTSFSSCVNGLKINWSKVDGAEKYRLYYKNSNGAWTAITDTAATSYVWSQVKNGTTYTFTVRCISSDSKSYTSDLDTDGKTIAYKSASDHKWGAWTTSGKKQTRKCSVCGATESKWITLAAPNNLVLSNTTTNGVTISYGKVAGADGYEIQYYHDGKWTHYVNTGYTSKKWEGAGWGPAGTYDIRVRAYIKTGSGLAFSENWSETKRFYTKPAKVTGLTTTSRSSDGTSLTLKWDAQKWATGYVVYRKGPNNTWVQLVTLTSPTENTYTVKGLTPVYDYGYRVRAYKGGSGNLGAYSDIHSTYTLPPKTKLYTVAQNGKGRMYVSWNLAKSYGYEVILSTKADFSSGNLKYTVSGMYNNKTNLRNLAAKNYYVKVRPYYNKPFGKIYGSWSDARQIKLISSPSLSNGINAVAINTSLTNPNCERYTYGKSVMGEPLDAFIISGNGKNNKTIFMDFAVHGFEDEYSNDGKVLIDLANELVKYYANNNELLGDYRMVIIPCANPDGVLFGTNNWRQERLGAFGRCTAKGIDINRDFKTGLFRATESKALRDCLNAYKPNIYLNFHGWENSVIGNPRIVSVFRAKVGLKTDKSNRYGSENGYIISWVKNTFKAEAAIVEFKNSKSVDRSKVKNAINALM